MVNRLILVGDPNQLPSDWSLVAHSWISLAWLEAHSERAKCMAQLMGTLPDTKTITARLSSLQMATFGMIPRLGTTTCFSPVLQSWQDVGGDLGNSLLAGSRLSLDEGLVAAMRKTSKAE